MGKFDGVLIASDYDNTLVYTEGALLSGTELPPLSRENREAIEYFMAQGGTFSVATGRALPAFAYIAPDIPMNGPTILFNGGAIYDFRTHTYLVTAFLPESIRPHLLELEQRFPGLTYEIYHDNNDIHAVNSNDLTRKHQHLTHLPSVEISSSAQAPSPFSKLLFEEMPPRGTELEEYVCASQWAKEFEVVRSGKYFLEITAKGANKGGMVEKLANLLGIQRQHVYCVGDHYNDLPMLAYASIPFIPDNAVEQLHRVPGVRVLPDCHHHTLAAMIRELDARYSK